MEERSHQVVAEATSEDREGLAWRTRTVVGTFVTAVALAGATLAFACTATHNGTIWFCDQADSTCSDVEDEAVLEFVAGATAYVQASSLQPPEANWFVRWVEGIDLIVKCRNSGNTLHNETDDSPTFPSGLGQWDDKQTSMPNVEPGDYTFCATTKENTQGQAVTQHENISIT